MQGGRGRGHPFRQIAPFPGIDSFDHPLGEFFQSSPFATPFMALSPFGPAGSPFMGATPFGPSFLATPFMEAHSPGIHDQRHSLPTSSRAPVIHELTSDDDEPEDGHSGNNNSHMRRRQPYVQEPYDGSQGRQLSQIPYGDQFNVMPNTHSRPQTQSFTFQSSTVAYGGSNGPYYTSSTTRRAGSDGLTFEEHKEADSVTGRAAHRVSRGIHDKGHTLSRHLKSDGQVDTMQTLHNINEDELTGFEEVWEGKARKQLQMPAWMVRSNAHEVGIEGSGEAGRGGGWALPSTENTHAGGRRPSGADEYAQSSKAPRR